MKCIYVAFYITCENKLTLCSRIKASNVRSAQKLNKTSESKNMMCFLKHKHVTRALLDEIRSPVLSIYTTRLAIKFFYLLCVYKSFYHLFVKPNNFFSIPHPFGTECVEPHQSILNQLPFIVFTKAALEAISCCSRRAASACKSLASSLLRLTY